MRTNGARTFGIIAGLALTGFSLLASTTWAGQTKKEEVTVNNGNPANRYASGSLGSARNATGDTNQAIGCSIKDTGVVTCFAKNATNVSLTCTTSGAGFRAAAQSLNGDSRIYFSVDPNGACLSLIVENHSFWAPKGA